MQIAVTSQNRKTITEHAGKCRKFWIYNIEAGAVTDKHLVELAIEESFHASHDGLAQPLTTVNVLITASMGAGLHQRLASYGITPILTMETDPDTAVAAYLANKLTQLSIDQCPDHDHHDGKHHGHHHHGHHHNH